MIKSYFPDLNDQEIIEFLENCEHKHFIKGSLLLNTDQFVKVLPLVISGTVKVVKEGDQANEILLYYISRGESCALSISAYLNHQQSQVKAIVEEDAQIILLPTRYIDGWMQKFPSWERFVIKLFRKRFQELLDTVDGIAFYNLDERLIKYLKKKSLNVTTREIMITHQEIANDLGTSREVVSRLLKQLEKRHMITLSRNKIKVLI
ncbi:MAG: Crp/Fnr family transcriptional regulator [Candidatus Cyclobacteriaceae bacterium M3_2C_046]